MCVDAYIPLAAYKSMVILACTLLRHSRLGRATVRVLFQENLVETLFDVFQGWPKCGYREKYNNRNEAAVFLAIATLDSNEETLTFTPARPLCQDGFQSPPHSEYVAQEI